LMLLRSRPVGEPPAIAGSPSARSPAPVTTATEPPMPGAERSSPSVSPSATARPVRNEPPRTSPTPPVATAVPAPTLPTPTVPPPTEPSPANETPVVPLATSPVPEGGFLLVTVEPWADVSVDGEAIGQTPLGKIRLGVGSHDVILTHPDYLPFRRRVSIKPSETFRLRVQFPVDGVRRAR